MYVAMHAAVQTTKSVVRNWRIRFMLASLLCAAPAIADEVPADLVRRVAARESETAQVQSNYTYRQSVSIDEIDRRGATVGFYREIRDIIFSPKQERTEQLSGKPTDTLMSLKLTDEDFRDIHKVHPLLLTKKPASPSAPNFRADNTIN